MQSEESQGQSVSQEVNDAPGPVDAPVPPPVPPSPIQAYLGQIEAFAFNFAPAGWLPCDGRMLPVTHYPALFSLLSVAYGGDGRNFGIPRLNPIGPNGPHYYISTAGGYPPRS